MDDLESIRRLKNGDIGGLEMLIARYQVKAVRTAFLVTHDAQIAEDIVQETFVRFYKRVHHFDEKRHFEPYFLRMVLNTALNVIAKEKYTIASLDADKDLAVLEHLLSTAVTVENEVEQRQMKQEILQAINALPPRQRLAAIQRFYLNMSEKEMSHAMEVSPGTIKWLLHAARTRLNALLGSLRSLE